MHGGSTAVDGLDTSVLWCAVVCCAALHWRRVSSLDSALDSQSVKCRSLPSAPPVSSQPQANVGSIVGAVLPSKVAQNDAEV